MLNTTYYKENSTEAKHNILLNFFMVIADSIHRPCEWFKSLANLTRLHKHKVILVKFLFKIMLQIVLHN